VFRVSDNLKLPDASANGSDRVAIRTMTRSLDGMQKEAIVRDSHSNTAWRMVCDEGPWLNGTDLSSFPLGFFSAGMLATLASEITALSRQREINMGGLRIVQYARYSMEGSALKGTMTGSAVPLEIDVSLDSDAPPGQIRELVYHALAASPTDAVMRTPLPGSFRITLCGEDVETGKVQQSTSSPAADPSGIFEDIEPADSSSYTTGIIEKSEDVDLSESEPAPAVGYAKEQKRSVLVGSELTLREDGLKSIKVRCVEPEGSTFNFLSDDPKVFGGLERAPTGLQYLSAGVSFCFMTQLGRYAAIVKQDLESYGIVQDTVFSLPGASAGLSTAATAEPVDTQVFITSSDGDDAARTLVDMGAQTCYLHASYEGTAKTRLKIGD
jgi:hypothetical protein